MEIVRSPIALATLETMAAAMFGELVKAVVDVESEIIVIDAELHSDEEALLLSSGSHQAALWGINLYPAEFGTPAFIEFDSMINVRPREGNRSRSVGDEVTRRRITDIVGRLVVA
jgi:Protein of unknown function (DUF5674)